MNEASALRGLAIEEPPLSPGPRAAVVASPAAAEGVLGIPDTQHATQRAAVRVDVTLRLVGGERIPVGSFETEEAAKQHAHVMCEEIRAAQEWLFLSGRFVRPEAIVSVDLDTIT